MADEPQDRSPIVPIYMVGIRETVARGDRAEIDALLDVARKAQAEYGDLESLIADLEGAQGGGSEY